MRIYRILAVLLCLVICAPAIAGEAWTLGTPITTYWGQPSIYRMSDETRSPEEMIRVHPQWSAEGGYNLVTVNTYEGLEEAAKHPGMRALFVNSGFEKFDASQLTDPAKRAAIDQMIDRLNSTKVVDGKPTPVYPAFYGYYITDEPLKGFDDLGKLVAYLRERDPGHLSYINMSGTDIWHPKPTFPTIEEYTDLLDRYMKAVHPALLSYDQYQLMAPPHGDLEVFLLNLEIVAQKARAAGIPFMTVVQACRWDSSWRTPNNSELRFLAYSAMAYGAQGISWFNYYTNIPDYSALRPKLDGTPSPIQTAVTPLNHEFVNVAKQYQRWKWIGTYLKGYKSSALPPGTALLPDDAPFKLSGVSDDLTYKKRDPVKGVLLGLFGSESKKATDAKFALVVNLDYTTDRTYTLSGPENLSTFDATTGTWTSRGKNSVELSLLPGGGVLVGLTSQVPEPKQP